MVRTRVGYAGGTSPEPTYHRLGDHSETVEVDYDASLTAYEDLLAEFWRAHDPRRPAYSVQYRSAILYRTEEERRAAELAVEAERKRLYALLDGLPAIVHLVKPDFSIRFAPVLLHCQPGRNLKGVVGAAGVAAGVGRAQRIGAKRLPRTHPLLRMPPAGRLAVHRLPSDGGVQAEDQPSAGCEGADQGPDRVVQLGGPEPESDGAVRCVGMSFNAMVSELLGFRGERRG